MIRGSNTKTTVMKHYVGLDVSMKETSICVVDSRKVVKEGKVGSEPETIAAWMERTGCRRRAESLRQWQQRWLQ